MQRQYIFEDGSIYEG